MRRVVVTGLGAVSPCGADAATTWTNVARGRSGIGRIQSFDPAEFPSQIAGECREFDPLDYMAKPRLRATARFSQFAIGASAQAIERAGFAPDEEEKERTGVFIGVGLYGIDAFETAWKAFNKRGPRGVSPYCVPTGVANMAPAQVTLEWGFKGPNYAQSSSCASGTQAIGNAFRKIQHGRIDAAVAGGVEAPITPTVVAGYGSLGVLSQRNDEPERASRPFDRDRDGFVIAEGAGVLMLEEREAAIARGADVLAEIAGYAATSDACEVGDTAPRGDGPERAMALALVDAELNPEDVDYVNAHGDSTPLGDRCEIEALRRVFGSHANDGLAVSSTKSTTGHLIGAAGGLEAVLCTLSMREGLVPPTINLENPESSAAGMNLVANSAQGRRLRAVMSYSFGLGGANCALVLKAP